MPDRRTTRAEPTKLKRTTRAGRDARSDTLRRPTPAEHLTVAGLDEMHDEDNPYAVRAWAPSAAFREAICSAAFANLALYVGIVETLADEADRDNGAAGETMH